MHFSDEYVQKLSELTAISAAEIRRLAPYLIQEVREVLTTARTLEPSGKLNKKIVSLVLKERSYQFI